MLYRHKYAASVSCSLMVLILFSGGVFAGEQESILRFGRGRFVPEGQHEQESGIGWQIRLNEEGKRGKRGAGKVIVEDGATLVLTPSMLQQLIGNQTTITNEGGVVKVDQNNEGSPVEGNLTIGEK